MQIQVLGCSGSIAAQSYTTAFLLDDDCLIDAGSGVGQLRLNELAAIDHVFLSHSHLDHVLALPLLADSVLRLRQDTDGRVRPITVYGLPQTLEAIQTHLFNNVIWPDFTKLPSARQPVLVLKPFAVGQRIHLPCANGSQHERCIEVLPAAHSVPGVGFAAAVPRNRWRVYSGDTGPNPALWQALVELEVTDLVIETAFSNEESALAEMSGHLAPAHLAQELAHLSPQTQVHITHTKPGEMLAIVEQIQQLKVTQPVQPLRTGQIFNWD